MKRSGLSRGWERRGVASVLSIWGPILIDVRRVVFMCIEAVERWLVVAMFRRAKNVLTLCLHLMIQQTKELQSVQLNLIGVVISFGLMTGCVDVPGTGNVLGWLDLQDCTPDTKLTEVCDAEIADLECSAFDLGANFFALELFSEYSAKVRLQRGGASFIKTDGIVLDFRDIRALRGRLGAPIAVGADQDVRAALILGQRCPSSTQSLELSGELVVSHFGTEVGDRIAGEILFLEVRDGREPLAGLIGVLRGGFDFVFRKGAPFEQFYR